jgi:hypothetical protein
MNISERIQSVPPSTIMELLTFAAKAKSEGKKVYHLNIGQPDIITPEGFLKAIREYKGEILEYALSEGLPELIESIKNYYKDYNLDFDNNEILITNGGSEALLFTMLTICDEGDNILVPEPFYSNYFNFSKSVGVNVNPITTLAENGFHLPSKEEIVSKINDKTKAILFSNPGNPTGVVYTKEELENIYKTCKENNLYLFIDGARISQALYASGMTLKDVVDNCDVCYFGGTKNGLPYGEMIIIKDKGIAENFHYHLKNRGAMLAKTYVLSMMFTKLLTDDLYLELGKNAVEKCNILKQGLLDLGVEVCYPNNTNQLFIKLDNKVVDVLSNMYAFEVWENLVDAKVIRLVTSWATSEEKVLEFLKDIKEIIK